MSYNQYRPTGFRLLPPVVKNLLIINGLFFLATIAFAKYFDLTDYLGLHYYRSPEFKPHQFVTYMFMHGGFAHIIFNMFALWMFGNALENVWGGKKFLIYYMVTGIGAGVLHFLVIHFQAINLESQMSQDQIAYVLDQGFQHFKEGKVSIDPSTRKPDLVGKLSLLYFVPTVGASGAVFGILLGFGMLFPNSLIYLYFAIPIKAKYFVMLYGAIELYFGIANNPGDNVAHFAHLGGMVFGYLLIRFWRKRNL
ncbi:MAG: rhomboid family intramembrane serine protease [Bacteroidales bacterium]|nr:rhomboid family intramembrane serine protease [Bacteroidales bacterium]